MRIKVSREIRYPNCDNFRTKNGKDFADHIYNVHTFKCMECQLAGFSSNEELLIHFREVHDYKPSGNKNVLCPKCKTELFDKEEGLVRHMEEKHSLSEGRYKVRDHVMAIWDQTPWEYFPATVRKYDKVQKKYTIDWDDGDGTGRQIDPSNMSLDKIPRKNDINIGTVVLFKQGSYCAGKTRPYGGERWHQGRITKMYQLNGHTYYNGVHMKSSRDGKNTCYSNYSHKFDRLRLKDLRIFDQHSLVTSIDDFEDHNEDIFNCSSSSESDLEISGCWTAEINEINIDNKKLASVGSRILAMWSESMWQYFHATIKRFDSKNLRYEIDWDDGDTTGRIVDYFNIAVDKVPDENEIGIGSIVLFSQGSYKARATQLRGGLRWHQGRITKCYKSEDGKVTLCDGVHTKGRQDGKFTTYKNYSYEFVEYKLDDLRIGPNVFDIIDTVKYEKENVTSFDDIDIYFSFDDSENNKNKEDIDQSLKSTGLKLIKSNTDALKKDLRAKANMMKNSKIFVACVDDSYTTNPECRMEFHYASSTLRKPVVPVVLANGKDWMKSTIGKIISGCDYIRLKEGDEEIKDEGIKEMMKSLNSHIKIKKEKEYQEVEENLIQFG